MRSSLLSLLVAVLAAGCMDDPPAPGQRGPSGTDSPAGSPADTSPAALEAPPPTPDRFRPLIGEYVHQGDTVSVLEEGGELRFLRWSGGRSVARLQNDSTLIVNGIDGPVTVRREDADGADRGINALVVEGEAYSRLQAGAENGGGFRIEPVRPVEELRAEALEAEPPREVDPPGAAGSFRPSELVEVVALDSTIRLDVRYATEDNFMGAEFYAEPRVFLQRPAAEALVRAHRWLNTQGYGVLLFDGYRPWYVTKMFWDATPESLRMFVANPAGGSRHNRGGAVDLTLYHLETGEPVEMPSGYDEFSPRASPHYRGGTMRERWHRSLLRLAMEAEGFTVYEAEWWHFDHEDWPHYRLGNQRFEEIGDG